jgi:hypothetical protein
MNVFQFHCGPEPSDLRRRCIEKVRTFYSGVTVLGEEILPVVRSFFGAKLVFDLDQWSHRVAAGDWVKLWLMLTDPDALYLDTDVEPLEQWTPGNQYGRLPYLLRASSLHPTDSCVMYANGAGPAIHDAMRGELLCPEPRFLFGLMLLPSLKIENKYFRHWTYEKTDEPKWRESITLKEFGLP